MSKVIILDGAMGTELQQRGLKTGENPEVFAMQHPEVLRSIHQNYIDAGSQVIYACTFGANRRKLEGTGHSAEKVITENVKIAKAAAAGRAKTALDIGPIGELLSPLGTLRFEEAYDIFKEEAEAGEKAGADLAVVETLTDLYEAKAALLAIKENTDLPVWVTMTFEDNGRTFLGASVSCAAQTLTSLGADAIGINCSLGPEEIYPLIKEMRDWTDLPLIVKPNAGLPDPKTGEYAIAAAEFAEQMSKYQELQVSAVGGCCGTTPEFIERLAEAFRGAERPSEEERRTQRAGRRGICSAGYMAECNGNVHVVGERINPTGKKRFQQALKDHDLDYIMETAIAEQDAGAEILDVNVGVPGLDEAELMKEVVEAVQSVVSIPLQIDSPEPEAVEAGLRAVNGRAIVNSVNGEPEKQAAILPIVKKYGAAVIGLTMDKSGLPQTSDDRVRIAENIQKACGEYGIPKEDLIIDCLTLTVSAQQSQAIETLDGVRRVTQELGLHTALGVSNISFGLPERTHVTESFLTQAMYCGLDFPIINPNSRAIMDAVASFRALSGQDENCMAYIERMSDPERKKEMEKSASKASPSAAGTAAPSGSTSSGPSDADQSPKARIERAILKGMKRETRDITIELMKTMEGMDIINQMIIPALDIVGDQYEKQILFLPQLINAADAACAGLDYIKSKIAGTGNSVSKGKIIVATVEGDIHDIGKNIVKVVLENYGYQVIDLGRDVPVQKVVDTAIEQDVHLIGLSALMTTTVVSMRKTVDALHASGHPCKIMVGGAVMTQEYADEMGADYYVRDAKASADAAKEVLG
ncbi:MAG: homocysteine S-methyltransferase family protein [Eubacterium sp.]|jgi:5-methyltetrahydrofolate--homocysteine methyltransferase|nr:homocysteine S-methyltransferase family protein [Eubacterium sp.]MCH4047318.1 homocysteine S-methyltransferase family protein [Eubacterium sp.]MCH4080414.1 homocysteine S-methyltransferase family protein [Eubacterium sp.]MCH4110662.1 homocysteine S-methyltransferase family protein [Eubacterium sp.]MCI1307212.1 homocysteine S-methyltransferase family protein [Eubacterium sp.]